MPIKFNSFDKIVIIACLIVIAFCSVYLMDFNYFQDKRNGGEKIGQIKINGQDVRKKINSEYFWQNITGLNQIYHGDSYYAGKKSNATIELDDGTTLQLKENSSVRFINRKNKISIDIVFGQVRVSAATKAITINDCSKEIQIESSKDSSFDVAKGQECGDVKINVNTGRIKMANQIADANIKVNLGTLGQSPLQKAFKFLDRPHNVKGHIQMTTTGGLELVAGWDPMKKASEYEIEVSPDADMKKDTKNYRIKTNQLIVPDVGVEKLYYRVRGNASPENPGEFGSVTTAVVKESLEPPQIQASELKLTSPSELSLNLSWLPAAKAAQYHVEVSESPDFTKPISQDLQTNTAQFVNLNQEMVYFRIRSENKFVKSRFSETTKVALTKENLAVPVVKSKGFEVLSQNELALNFNWKPVEKSNLYQVEVSETADFSKPIVQVVKKPAARFTGLAQTAVYVRVRAENNFSKGKYSEPLLSEFSFNSQSKGQTVTDRCNVLKTEDAGSKKDFEVDWQPVPLASEYKVKVIDKKKANEVSQAQTRKPAGTITLPACGEYEVNVEAFDKSGRKISSEFNATKISYKSTLYLLKPIITEAQKSLNIFFQKGEGRFVWLKWIAEVKPDSFFKVEMATNSAFTENQKTYNVRDNKLLLKSVFQADKYFWRVREQKSGLLSEWSDVAQIKILTKNSDANK